MMELQALPWGSVFVTTHIVFAQVFAGAIAALSVMTVLSAALGWAAPNLVSVYAVHAPYSAISHCHLNKMQRKSASCASACAILLACHIRCLCG